MFRHAKYLIFFFAISILSVAGVTLASPSSAPVKSDPVTVCYFVQMNLTNISSSRQSVEAYVINIATKERTSGTFTFSLEAGQSGTFRVVVLIPDPKQVFQFLDGSWYSNTNMKITNYSEGFLPLADCVGHTFNDGRLNDGEDQHAAPVVAYCEAGDLTVYDIDEQSRGNYVFRVSLEDISAGLNAAAAAGTPQVLGEGGGDTLYALPSSELQLVGPEIFNEKTYNYIFAGDVCGTPDA